MPEKPTARFLYLHISRSDNGYGTRRPLLTNAFVPPS
nr:MAG TPA: hypothetical protein [Caudoviricetes sp.]